MDRAVEDEMLMAERRQAAAAATPADCPAFEEVYSAYRTPLYNYIYRLVGDREQAADLLQETFVKVYRALDSLPDGAGRTPWLYRIATNTCYDVLRRRRLIAWLPWTRDYTSEVGRRDESPGERYAVAEGVHDALRAVPLNLRAPLLLHAVHGFCYADIALALGISEAAVKMRVSRARAAFRAAYQAGDGEGER
jgi:RNA polymerase sigma-70 factor (ECF subfamily)